MSNMDQLFSMDAFTPEEESRVTFMAALKEELIFHYENNALYKAFCDRKNFSPYDDFDLQDIPPVAVSVFKNLGGSLSSVPTDDIKLRLQSSATSGVPSTVVVDKVTSKRQSKAMVKVIQTFIGKHALPFLVMDIDPRAGYSHLLGARFAAVSGYLKFSSKTGYFLKSTPESVSYFDVDGMKNFLEELGDTPVVLFGFTYLLYAHVLKEIDQSRIKLRLPKGSKILHIGGWKKLESEKISKDLFNRGLSERFGVDESDIIDVYGFTEQMGLNYPDCTDGWKRTPSFSRVLVRDPVTHAVLPAGQEGVLEFITPIPHSYPGNAVLTDDLGVVCDGAEGLPGTRFKVTGRMKKAEVRGCGDILSQKLTFQREMNPAQTEEKLSVILHQGGLSSEKPEERLMEIIGSLRKKQTWLREQPAEAIIGLIADVAGQWIHNPDLLNLKDKGLVFVSSWLDKKHLTSLAELGLRGDAGYLDSFRAFPHSDAHMLKANPRGLVCHWLAGNVQILGMFALAQSIIAKNVNLLRVSSKDEGVFQKLLETFRGAAYTTENGYTVRGDELLETIALVSYPHDNRRLGEMMSREADVRIAWGGAESVRTVAAFPSRIGAETVIFGPKLSLAAIAKESLSSPSDAKKLARRLSVDVSVFDQTGCASPHNLFIETGGAVSVREFAALLSEEMAKAEIRIPKPPMSVEQVSQVHSIRGVYDFKGEVIGSDTLSWTLLLEDEGKEPELCAPVYSRVLFIHPVKSIFDCLQHVGPDIQTIGLEAPAEKAAAFAEKATVQGVERLPQIGRMLNFEMPWDGVFLFDRLVRWNTLGGPLR